MRPEDTHRLAVLFPSQEGEPPLIGIPLTNPMGWVCSPPNFSSCTETIADLANVDLSDSEAVMAARHTPHRFDTLSESVPEETAETVSTVKHTVTSNAFTKRTVNSNLISNSAHGASLNENSALRANQNSNSDTFVSPKRCCGPLRVGDTTVSVGDTTVVKTVTSGDVPCSKRGAQGNSGTPKKLNKSHKSN